jgi:carbamoyl-phosphate synthase large subunit
MNAQPHNGFVLFICGGKWQMPWLQFLKDKGHRIILVDPYETSPCVTLADIHLKRDARDVEGILQDVFEGGWEIQFVSSDQTDVSTDTVAMLSERLGTRGNHPEAVFRFSNKAINREFVQALNPARIPAFARIHDTRELSSFLQSTGSDIMVKPADAQSSRGIARLAAHSSPQDIAAAFNNAQCQTTQYFVVAEQFIQGTEITVEGIKTPKGHHTLAISAKKHFRTGIASELRYPAPLGADLQRKLTEFHNNLIDRSGLDYGITHAEYIVADPQFYLVEMACRGGGTLIPSDIVPHVSGVDVYEALYQLQMGNEPEMNPKAEPANAILYFFEFPAGKVERIEGLEKAASLPGVHRLELEFAEGDILKPAGDDRGRQGFAIVLAPDAATLEARLQALIATLNITVKPVTEYAPV